MGDPAYVSRRVSRALGPQAVTVINNQGNVIGQLTEATSRAHQRCADLEGGQDALALLINGSFRTRLRWLLTGVRPL